MLISLQVTWDFVDPGAHSVGFLVNENYMTSPTTRRKRHLPTGTAENVEI